MRSILFSYGVGPVPDTIIARVIDEALWQFYKERKKLPRVILSQSKGRYLLADSSINGQLYAQYEHTDMPHPAELATE